MDDKFAEILGLLEIKDGRLSGMRQQVVAGCQTRGGPQRMLKLFMSKSSLLCFCGDSFDKVIFCAIETAPFCSMFRAYIYFRLSKYHDTIKSAANAVEYFELNAQPVNQALALWSLGLALHKMKNHHQARLKLKAARKILEKEIQQERRFGKYPEVARLEPLDGRITGLLDQIAS